MFLEERYNEILKEINKDGRVKVKDLAFKFKVTEDCIRKDLKELEKREKLKRVYGGAITIKIKNDVKPIDERRYINYDIKKKIAKKALNIIDTNDVIFLDISTINLELAKELNKSEKKVTVVTNMIEIVLELKMNNNIKVISVGGEFNKEIGGIVGAAADRYINKFNYDKSFIGLCGIDKKSKSISTINLEDGNTKKTIIECSKDSFLVMENEKFNYTEFYKFATLDDITAIISEK